MWHSRPPRDPPPFMANAILNFHFDYLNPSLILPINCLLDREAKLLMKMEDRKQMSTLKEELSSMILITIPLPIETIPS